MEAKKKNHSKVKPIWLNKSKAFPKLKGDKEKIRTNSTCGLINPNSQYELGKGS